MTYIPIITTSQAPDAKPIAFSGTLSDDWISIITVPSYEVPQQSFGGGVDVVPGVGEIISPLLVSNFSAATALISIRVYRENQADVGNNTGTYFFVMKDVPIPTNDMIPIPLNGQFIFRGDTLDVKASVNSAIDVTISYTLGQAEQDDVI
jgi:hypothetical protein